MAQTPHSATTCQADRRRVLGARGWGRLCLAAALVLGGLAPAWAGAAPAKKAEPAAADDKREDTVAMPPLVVPVMRGERLWGQAFVKLELVVPRDIWAVRARVPALQDALVRTVHRYPLALDPEDKAARRGLAGAEAAERLKPLLPLWRAALRDRLGSDLVEEVVTPKVFLRPF